MSFDPYTCTKEDMKDLADHLESYLDIFDTSILVPSKFITARELENIKEGIKRTKKLIKKLRKGKKDEIFRDLDDCQSLY